MNKKPRILVVDDEAFNLRLIEAFLADEAYEIIFARNGKEALLHAQGGSPDVILMDAMLPDGDGFQIAKKLKEDDKTKIIPIVMVTSLNGTRDRIKALEAGIDDFLTKPVDRTELIARVRSLLKVKCYNDQMINYQAGLETEVEKGSEQLKHAMRKIREASLDTIHRLSRAAEYKDEDTGSHIIRMSRYAAAVARKMGMNAEEVEFILYASPMHDVGKISVPDRILLKPGKLDSEEWEIMKQHTLNGARILEGSESDFLKLAEEIALTHHEKWDGNGYPHQLKGTGIPLPGRITAIADVFDALSSNRPYKEAFSIDKSLDIIKESRGTHFDPDVVDSFVNILDEILSIKAEFAGDGLSQSVKAAIWGA